MTPTLQLTAGARYIHEFNSKVGGTWKDVNKNTRVKLLGDAVEISIDRRAVLQLSDTRTCRTSPSH